MSTTVRPVFLRPFQCTYTGNAFSISGGDSYSDFPQGTYANVLSLARSICNHLANDAVPIVASMSDDFKIQLTSIGADRTIVWDNTDIRDAIGFTGASTFLPSGVATPATYTPQYTWIPEFQRGDQGGFARDLGAVASGSECADGTWIGIAVEDTQVYRTTIVFPMELETNLVVDAADSAVYKAARCMETFLVGALTATVTNDDCVSPRGFWYYPDINDAIAQLVMTGTDAWADSATDIGVHFGWTTGEDTKVFCAVSPGELGDLRASPSLPVGRLRYGYEFSFHTCPAPDAGWQVVEAV
jgi:hypothetical protein